MFKMHRKAYQNRNIKVIKRSNKIVQALILPKIMNVNPRSAMNKIQELNNFIKEEDIDVAFISESHDRENMRLEEHLLLEDHPSNIEYLPEGWKGGKTCISCK